MSKELVKTGSFELSNPNQMVQAAKQIKDYIVKNNLSVQIVGKDYVMVEGFQFAGSLMALYPRIVEVKELSANRWLAHAEIVNRNNNEVVGSGYAICSKTEAKKASFDEYAILSMAQTRAIGKAFRNVIGWIIKLAGYQGTPAEEMAKKGEVKETKPAGVGGLEASEADIERIKSLAKEMGLNTISQIEKKTGIKVDFNGMTKVMAGRVYAELLNKHVSK